MATTLNYQNMFKITRNNLHTFFRKVWLAEGDYIKFSETLSFQEVEDYAELYKIEVSKTDDPKVAKVTHVDMVQFNCGLRLKLNRPVYINGIGQEKLLRYDEVVVEHPIAEKATKQVKAIQQVVVEHARNGVDIMNVNYQVGIEDALHQIR